MRMKTFSQDPCLIYTSEFKGSDAKFGQWTHKQNKTEAYKMYVFREILRISWQQRVTNVPSFEYIKEKPVNSIVEREIQYLGDVKSGKVYELFQLIIEGKLQSKR